MQMSGHPAKLTIVAGLLNEAPDLIDRGRARFPERSRAALAELADKVRKPLIGYIGQMRGGAGRVRRGGLRPIDERDAHVRLAQEIRGCDTGEPRTDHDDLDFEVPLERREVRKLRFNPGGVLLRAHVTAFP